MPNGQTIIQYGPVNGPSGVTLLHCETRRVDQRPVFDSGGVSLKCWKFLIVGTGYLLGNPGSVAYSVPIDPAGAATTHQRLRWRLLPRQSFQMAVGCVADSVFSGSTLLFAAPMEGVSQASLATNGLTYYDVDDGPKCLQFDIIHMAADNTFKVEFAFEINRVQCTDSDTAASNSTGVLSHRWASADSIDVNWRTTRTYHGVLEIATSQWSPHWFRSLVVPPLQNGMRREHMEFIADESGKKLQYSVTDVDIDVAAPYPARTWMIDHTISSLNGDPMKCTEHISVVLTGDHNVDKGQLIVLGLYVIAAKLRDAPTVLIPPQVNFVPGGIFWNDLTISDKTGLANTVALSASVWRRARQVTLDPEPNGNQPKIALASRYKAFRLLQEADLPTFSKPYNPNQSSGGRDVDTLQYQGPISLASIFRCYLQVPCNDTHAINVMGVNQTADTNPSQSNNPRQSISAVVGPAIPDTSLANYSSSQLTSMYTAYQMESRYSDNTLRAAMPIARSAYSGGGVDLRDGTSVVTLASTQTRRRVRIYAERVNDWPEFPDGEMMDGKIATTQSSPYSPIVQTLLRKKLLSRTVITSINGESLFVCRWEAVYALSRAPRSDENVKIGDNKWQTDGLTATTPTLTQSLQENPSADTGTYVPGGGLY